jgi:hypothetical protein
MHATAKLGAAMLVAALATACATPTSPRFALSEDCRLLEMPWSGAAAPSSGIGIGGATGGDLVTSMLDSRGRGTVSVGRPRIDVGPRIFGIDRTIRLPRAIDLLPQWLVQGPGFADGYSNSCMPIRCVVRGGWPMVVDFTQDGESDTTIEIHAPELGAPIVFELDKARGRHLQQFRLPDRFGATTRPAVLLVRSTRRGAGAARPGRVRIHGLGAGPRAVGSVAIDQVSFAPPLVRHSAGQQASYSFLSKSDFNRVSVSVLKVDNVDGEIRVGLVREFRFEGGISRGAVFGRAPPRVWDGSDAQDEPSIGSHLLQVRAWMSAREDGDWVTAWSERAVQVTE